MSDSAELIKLRATYEHYTSEPDKRKLYVTLGFTATDEEVLVLYARDDKRDVVYAREFTAFMGETYYEGHEVKRFTLVEEDVIDDAERALILSEDPDYEIRS